MSSEKFFLKSCQFGKKTTAIAIPTSQKQNNDIGVCNILLVQRDAINKSDGIELDEVAFIISSNYSHSTNINIILEKSPRRISDTLENQNIVSNIRKFLSNAIDKKIIRFNIIAHHYDSCDCTENVLSILCNEVKNYKLQNPPEIQLVSCASAQYRQNLRIMHAYPKVPTPILFLSHNSCLPDKRSLLTKTINMLYINGANNCNITAFNALVVPGIFKTGIKLNNNSLNIKDKQGPFTIQEMINKYPPFEKDSKNTHLFRSSGQLHFLPLRMNINDVYKSGHGISYLEKEKFRDSQKSKTPIVSVHLG